ncbi:protein mono-ADP-ribosyltransferase PARP11 isoform X2 [Sphaerodactylus townsendi]|uniref:protein mono-ADP-ribosyltransferase PARP11 isoform X2 n=1 Tax=Sphaerodactylus townsendi TaxID=933632 RepID=UPI0020271FE6|nr:protein mono-ADP-ribosyltransferase PARP11 isoform X2 [Sphaerodactylus townsendi]
MFQGGDDFSQNGAGQLEEMDTSDTQWGWFYLAECGKWHMFETDSSTHCSVSTEDIERSFRMNPEDSVGFTTAKFNYRLDFSGMKQTNLTTGKQRPIKRAPFSITAFSYVCENQSIPIPSHWENVNSEEAYQFIPLQKQTNEYKEVASHFGETMEGSRIKRIQRIQNLDLWEFFCRLSWLESPGCCGLSGLQDLIAQWLLPGSGTGKGLPFTDRNKGQMADNTVYLPSNSQ